MKTIVNLLITLWICTLLCSCATLPDTAVYPNGYLDYVGQKEEPTARHESFSAAYDSLRNSISSNNDYDILVFHGYKGVGPILISGESSKTLVTDAIMGATVGMAQGLTLDSQMILVFVDAQRTPISDVLVIYSASTDRFSLGDLHFKGNRILRGRSYQIGGRSFIDGPGKYQEYGATLAAQNSVEFVSLFRGMRMAIWSVYEN